MNDALHIYPTNKQVNKYNLQTMHGKCPESMCIEAKDYEKDGSGQLKLREKPLQSERTLCRSLWIGVGARVMLTRNICFGWVGQRGFCNCCWNRNVTR